MERVLPKSAEKGTDQQQLGVVMISVLQSVTLRGVVRRQGGCCSLRALAASQGGAVVLPVK